MTMIQNGTERNLVLSVCIVMYFKKKQIWKEVLFPLIISYHISSQESNIPPLHYLIFST